MSQFPTRGGNSGKPILSSDQQGFDRRWFAPSLQAVYVPTRSEEVAECVTDALVTYGKDVKISSGRHCYENFVYNNSTRAVIDMSAINQVGFDTARNAYFIDAGCENWSVYRTLLNSHGKTLPAGSCYSVGAGGHITGGGYGLLSRMHGLTIDHLTGLDLVTWDAASKLAKLRYVSNDSPSQVERDLYWALTGAGGGNFGVIVRYYFKQLPDAPDYATQFTLAWDWSDVTQELFADLLELYAELMPQLPDNEFTLLKLNHVAANQLGMTLQIASLPGMTYDQHSQHASVRAQAVRQHLEQVLPAVHLRQPLGGHPGYMSSTSSSLTEQHLTYLEAVQTLNGSGPNQFGKYKSAYMKKGFPADQITTIYKYLHLTPNGPNNEPLDMKQCLLQVDSYGGAINRVSPAATAVPQRSSIMKLQYQAYWNNAADPGQADKSPYREMAQAYLNWINQFYADVYAAMGDTPDPLKDASGTVDVTTTTAIACLALMRTVGSIRQCGCTFWITSATTSEIWLRSNAIGTRKIIFMVHSRFHWSNEMSNPSDEPGINEPEMRRENRRAVTPYITVHKPAELVDFVTESFGAIEHFRATGSAGGMHAEVSIGDSIVMIGGAEHIEPKPVAIHLYVPDVDQVYERALGAGAKSLMPVADQPYGERSGAVEDVHGNRWYIATTFVPLQTIAPDLHTVTVYFHPIGAQRFIDFLTNAFGGRELMRHAEGDMIMHAKVQIGDSVIELGEARYPTQPLPSAIYLYVKDVDTIYEQALKAGATSMLEPVDQPFGDRNAWVKDPFDNVWYVAAPIRP